MGPQVQPLPHVGPEPAGRPSLGPQERRRSRGGGLQGHGGEWAGLGQLWHCGTTTEPAGKEWAGGRVGRLQGRFPSPEPGGCTRPSGLPPRLRPGPTAWPPTYCPGCRRWNPIPGPDPQEPRPSLARSPAGLAALSVSSFPSRAKLQGCMARGPGLLPGSLPASQAPGQGPAAPCNPSFPATL